MRIFTNRILVCMISIFIISAIFITLLFRNRFVSYDKNKQEIPIQNNSGQVQSDTDKIIYEIREAASSEEADPLFDDLIGLSVNELKQEYEYVTDEKRIKYEAALKSFNETLENRKDKIGSLINDSDEEQKSWIGDMIVERFNSDSSANNRYWCLAGLSEMPFNEYRDLYLQALANDSDRNVREIAASILGRYGNEEDIDELYNAVKEDRGVSGEGRSIARKAISSIGSIGGEKAVNCLNDIWNDSELSMGCREFILEALGNTGETSTFEFLKTVLEGDDTSLYESAIVGMRNMTSLNRDNERIIDQYIKLLQQYISSNNPRIRLQVAYSLGGVGRSEEDISLLKRLLQDDYTAIQSTVVDGVVKEEKVYPVREQAQKSIDWIRKRMESTELNALVQSLRQRQ